MGGGGMGSLGACWWQGVVGAHRLEPAPSGWATQRNTRQAQHSEGERTCLVGHGRAADLKRSPDRMDTKVDTWWASRGQRMRAENVFAGRLLTHASAGNASSIRHVPGDDHRTSCPFIHRSTPQLPLTTLTAPMMTVLSREALLPEPRELKITGTSGWAGGRFGSRQNS